MNKIDQLITARLAERDQEHALRRLSVNHGLVDFSSNDYLGFSRSAGLRSAIENELQSYPDHSLGAKGSRLLCGNDHFTEELEAEIAHFHDARAGLIFNSGYDANLGLFSSLPQRGDTIICDELIHASVIDGARMSLASRWSFRHNDLDDLEEKLNLAKGRIFIAVESIYSMDGDEAHLPWLVLLAEKYGAALIIDEAHATGIYGRQGRGLVDQYGLTERVFARVVTFGKALGTHGAILLGNDNLRDYLINFARSFIYSTAAPFQTHLSVKMAYRYLQKYDHQAVIREKITLFRQLTQHSALKFIDSSSAIQSLIVGGNEQTRYLSRLLRDHGFDVRPILPPTVPPGKERLRICLHTYNTDGEILRLIALLNEFLS